MMYADETEADGLLHGYGRGKKCSQRRKNLSLERRNESESGRKGRERERDRCINDVEPVKDR